MFDKDSAFYIWQRAGLRERERERERESACEKERGNTCERNMKPKALVACYFYNPIFQFFFSVTVLANENN